MGTGDNGITSMMDNIPDLEPMPDLEVIPVLMQVEDFEGEEELLGEIQKRSARDIRGAEAGPEEAKQQESQGSRAEVNEAGSDRVAAKRSVWSRTREEQCSSEKDRGAGRDRGAAKRSSKSDRGGVREIIRDRASRLNTSVLRDSARPGEFQTTIREVLEERMSTLARCDPSWPLPSLTIAITGHYYH
jgi:hypothetical protein